MSMARFEEAEGLRSRGDLAKAYAIYDELALELENRGALQAQAEMIRLSANCLHETGRIPEAQKRREKALSLAPAHGHNEIVYGALLGDLGRGYLDLHQYDKARPWIEKALHWARTHNMPDLLRVQTLNLGLLECREKGYHGPGKGLLEDSLERALQVGDLPIEALARLNLGLAAFEVLLYKEAAEHLLRAQEIGRSLGLPLILRESEETLAKIQLLRNPDSQSFQALDQLRKINETNRDRARKAGDILGLVQLGRNQGRIEEALGNYSGAAAVYMELIYTLEEVRQHLLYDDLRESFFSTMNEAYEKALVSLIGAGQKEMALEVVDRHKSRILLDSMGRESRSLPKDPALAKEVEALEKEISSLYEILLGDAPEGSEQRDLVVMARKKKEEKGEPGQKEGEQKRAPLSYDQAQNRLEELKIKHKELMERIQRDEPAYSLFSAISTASSSELRSTLLPEEQFLIYQVGEKVLTIFLADAQTFSFVQLEVGREAIEREVSLLRSYMDALRESYFCRYAPAEMAGYIGKAQSGQEELSSLLSAVEEQAKWLYALLIGPVLGVLPQAGHLCIIPHGPLHLLPFAMLKGSEGYLMEQCSLSTAPSATVARFCLSRTVEGKDKAPLILADPDGSLPGALREAEEMGRVFSAQPQILRGVNATPSQLRENLPLARILHLACHAVFDPIRPEFSFFKLAPDATGKGLLHFYEIPRLPGQVKLAFLSACETGVVEVRGGDEVVGLSRAFLQHLTPTVVSTLWKVDDEATCTLVPLFYRNLLGGLGPAQALVLAQRELKKNPSFVHPFYWAPFGVMGSWR